MTIDRILFLNEAKNILAERMDSELTLNRIRQLNENSPFGYVISKHEIDVAYLHMLIIFKSPSDVNDFLYHYWNFYGNVQLEMIINYRLADFENNRYMTVIDCALLWNTDPEMVRILYKWGANVNISNYQYLENICPYRNYLACYRLTDNNLIYSYPDERRFGSRQPSEFRDVANEHDYIGNLKERPENWDMPSRVEHLNENENTY